MTTRTELSPKTDLSLGVVGNGSYAALIDRQGRVVWACLPRLDGDPVFCALLRGDGDGDGDGHGAEGGNQPVGDRHDGAFAIELAGCARIEQNYRGHTAILETRLYDQAGGAIEIVDFAPRFERYGRTFRPVTLMRHVRPISGTPQITIRLRPLADYGATRPERTRGSNHIRYLIPDGAIRLTTDAPVTYITDEIPFVLDRPCTLALGPDEPIIEALPALTDDFLGATDRYWRDWSRSLAVPFEWQSAVIRAAITLKLCSFEETGAVVAALTTSIPESRNSGRNWDYRFCWLRDAYFTLHALNRLGKTRTLERYLTYITNLVVRLDGKPMQPVYGIGTEAALHERIVAHLPGYRGMGPVRVGNAAYAQVQNDSYGAIIVACAHVFYDERLDRPDHLDLFRRLERLGETALSVFDQPDAGLWELRTRAAVHTFSAVMCWAAVARLARIAGRLGLGERADYWREHARRLRQEIERRAWNPTLNSFVATFDGDDADASLLLLSELNFLEPDDPRFAGTVDHVGRMLLRGDFLLRYATPDDFGVPEVAFTVCSFWYVNALAVIGRRDEARALFVKLLEHRNPLGLLSEDIDTETGELWGNFPQTYSMVGLILCAIRLSKPWDEAF
ncbi:glucoamylase [Aliidongia dinghuensis]|uniref:Glucoamylase n=1 Tax=Aliidongia dinghuensis TaxID=1867774 RepID=A0A8J2YWY0_9PROT|nr:glycoside hydrolase family 15 protein [Aliidongia dinghuensis]GGF33952.1 glucoamylase [Aliidongia dinghuensis]